MECNPDAFDGSPGMRRKRKGDLHMADLLGVTNPVPSYDAPNNNRTVPTSRQAK